jgi:hypothetical protein
MGVTRPHDSEDAIRMDARQRVHVFRCSRSATFLEHAQQSMAHSIGSIAKVVFRLFG